MKQVKMEFLKHTQLLKRKEQKQKKRTGGVNRKQIVKL